MCVWCRVCVRVCVSVCESVCKCVCVVWCVCVTICISKSTVGVAVQSSAMFCCEELVLITNTAVSQPVLLAHIRCL